MVPLSVVDIMDVRFSVRALISVLFFAQIVSFSLRRPSVTFFVFFLWLRTMPNLVCMLISRVHDKWHMDIGQLHYISYVRRTMQFAYIRSSFIAFKMPLTVKFLLYVRKYNSNWLAKLGLSTAAYCISELATAHPCDSFFPFSRSRSDVDNMSKGKNPFKIDFTNIHFSPSSKSDCSTSTHRTYRVFALFAMCAVHPNNQTRNEINLNSNTVLSLFIFKQPSGSETKLKFKMRIDERVREREPEENSSEAMTQSKDGEMEQEENASTRSNKIIQRIFVLFISLLRNGEKMYPKFPSPPNCMACNTLSKYCVNKE